MDFSLASISPSDFLAALSGGKQIGAISFGEWIIRFGLPELNAKLVWFLENRKTIDSKWRVCGIRILNAFCEALQENNVAEDEANDVLQFARDGVLILFCQLPLELPTGSVF